MSAMRKGFSLLNEDRRLIIQVTAVLLMIRVGLRVLPVKTLNSLAAWDEKDLRTPRTTEPAHKDRVVRAISAVARRVLGEGTCLTQALAAQLLLKRRGYEAQLCIGVAKDSSGRVIAHAWVEHDGEVVIGGPRHVLECYTRLPMLERVGR